MASRVLPFTKPVRSADPTFEPVTLEEAKKQCEIAAGVDYHDSHLMGVIQQARETVEDDTGLAIGTGTYTWKFTDWPCTDYFEIPGVRPVTSITSIVYVDSGGTSQTWSTSDYVLETSTVTPIVRLAHLATWPTLRGDINGITVTMVAGYATRLSVTRQIKEAVLSCVLLNWKRDAATENDVNLYERLVQRLRRATYP